MRPHKPHQTKQYNGRSIDPTLLTFVDDIAKLTIDEKTSTGGEETLLSIEKPEKTPILWFQHWPRSDASWSSPGRWSYQCGWAVDRWSPQSNPEPMEDRQVERKQQDTYATSSISTNNTIIQKRIAAPNTGYFAYAGVWRSRNISFKSKSFVLKKKKHGTQRFVVRTRGLRLHQRRDGQTANTRDALARRAVGRRGWVTTTNERTVQMGKSPVGTLDYRKHAEIQTTEMVALHGKPAISSRYGRAVLFGKYEWQSFEEIGEFGHTTEKALPYVKHWYRTSRVQGVFKGFERVVQQNSQKRRC